MYAEITTIVTGLSIDTLTIIATTPIKLEAGTYTNFQLKILLIKSMHSLLCELWNCDNEAEHEYLHDRYMTLLDQWDSIIKGNGVIL